MTIYIVTFCAPGGAWADAVAPPTPPADAKNDVTQIIYVDGKPARHDSATLFDCQTGDTLVGPIETDDNGSVTWPKIKDGKDCIRLSKLAGSGSAADVIDHSAKAAHVDLTVSSILPTISEQVLPYFLCAGCLLLVAIPIGQFLLGPWSDRRDKLRGALAWDPSKAPNPLTDPYPLKLYYQRFRANVDIAKDKKPSDKTLTPQDFDVAFIRDFESWYGRRYYFAPCLVLLVITAYCAWWGTREAQGWISGTRSIDSMSGLAAAALTGGFMWVISDEIDRLRRRDFTTSDIYYYIFRILLSVPFAWAITRLQLTLQVGIPTAIFLGAFPTSSLLTIARRVGNQKLGLGDDPGTGQLELEKLRSIGKTNAERFREADVANISQLTRADPVDLAIRTNFDFDYISECVNEALLWVYVGDELDKLAVFSVRGACEARDMVDDYNGADAKKQPRAKQTILDIVAAFAADKIVVSEASLIETLTQAGFDPYTEFLKKIWH